MTTERHAHSPRWSALPMIVAVVCVATAGWVQVRTAGLIALMGAFVHVAAAAVTFFAAFLVGYQPKGRRGASYAASIAFLIAILFQWDAVEPHGEWMRIVMLLGPDHDPPVLFTLASPLVMSVLAAVPWLIALSVTFATFRRNSTM